jgi:hypothetical protein
MMSNALRVMGKRTSAALLFIVAMFTAALFLNGCKNGCEDVVCAPAPPPLTVTVRDTITTKVSVPVIDSVTSDTTFVLVDSVITAKSGLADVVLVDPADDLPNAVSHILHFDAASDSLYQLDDLTGVGGGPYLLVVSRGARSDTIPGLLRDDVEGCCAYSVIGNYTVTMAKE